MKTILDNLQDAEVTAQKRVLVLQKELSIAQSDLVGVREQLRITKEQYRRSELAKVIPVYGRREELIDNLRLNLPELLEKVEVEDRVNLWKRGKRNGFHSNEG